MAMLRLVIQREFVSNVLTSRFMIGFIVCLLSTAVAVFVQIDDYETRLAGYNTAVREAATEAPEWELYSKIKPKAHRKPNPLGIFNVGTENFGANTVTIELAKPIFELNFPMWGAPTQKRGSDNPFLTIFLTVDVVFIFKIVLSALAILFAYNTISGEREDGTLKLVLSNSIPRDIIVLGKYLGGMLSLFPIVLVSLIVALLMALSSGVAAFDGNDIAHVVLIFAVSLLYVSTWYLLGLLLSIWTKTATTSLILSMFIWVLLTSVHSNIVTFAVEKFPPHQMKPESVFLQSASEVWNQFRKERDTYLKQRGYENITKSITWEPQTTPTGTRSSSWSGGYFLIENYSVNSVSKADTSIFQEILGYQEQLRAEYAGKAEEILNKPAEERERNAKFADALSRISFADVYHFAVGTIAGTDRQHYNDFIQNSRAYKREIVEYLKDKEAFSSRAWFSNDQGPAALTDLPGFEHKRLSLSESFSRASVDILILLAWNIVLFMVAYVSFLRYEMS
ncbi:MAG: ABC transporter permease [Candidatus Poribacteria bacterium]|nr:ABC transporter permease [Candidatus Poribacteria bacterium]